MQEQVLAGDGGGHGSIPTMPLNSPQLSVVLLRLGCGLGIPTTASSGDLCPMVEGKLTEASRHPLHTGGVP